MLACYFFKAPVDRFPCEAFLFFFNLTAFLELADSAFIFDLARCLAKAVFLACSILASFPEFSGARYASVNRILSPTA